MSPSPVNKQLCIKAAVKWEKSIILRSEDPQATTAPRISTLSTLPRMNSQFVLALFGLLALSGGFSAASAENSEQTFVSELVCKYTQPQKLTVSRFLIPKVLVFLRS